MEALFLLVPLSLAAVGVAVLAFFRMSADGQFDDAEGPAWSVLMDDDRPARATDPRPPSLTEIKPGPGHTSTMGAAPAERGHGESDDR